MKGKHSFPSVFRAESCVFWSNFSSCTGNFWILVFAEAWSMPLFGLHFLPFRVSFLFTFLGGEKEIKVNFKDKEMTTDGESKSYLYCLRFSLYILSLHSKSSNSRFYLLNYYVINSIQLNFLIYSITFW